MNEDEIKALKAKRQARLERAITPQGSGCAPRYSPPPITVKLPKWDYWRHMPTVAPWEACALALNIEPDSVDYRPESWDGQPETWRGFPSDEIGDHFIKLLQLLNANQFEKQHFTENFAMGVRLSEFAAWCANVVRDLTDGDIPQELAALAVEKLPEATGEGSESGDAAKGEAVPAITTHKLKTKNMPLDAEIATAKSRALDKTNVQSVWDELVKMANKQEGCLIGEGDLNELQYGSRQDPQIFTKKMLTDRMRGRKNRANPR